MSAQHLVCDASSARLVWPWQEWQPGLAAATMLFGDKPCAQQAVRQEDLPDIIRDSIPRRQAEYFAGRCCAKCALVACGGPGRFPGMSNTRRPIWPPCYVGSIAHSHHVAIAVAGPQSTYRSIGVDIEKIMTHEISKNIRDLVLTRNEQKTFSFIEEYKLVSLAFSIKEALFKALNPLTDHFFNFLDAEIIKINEHERITIKLLCDLNHEWRTGSIIMGQYTFVEKRVYSLIVIKDSI